MAKDIRVAVISHTYTVAANRGKWEKLAKNRQYRIDLITPHHWNTDLGNYQINDGLPRLKVHSLSTVFNGNISRFFYLGLRPTLKKLNPDIIHVEQEYSSLSLLQVVFLRRIFLSRSKLVAFTWENLYQKLPWYYRLIERINLASIDSFIAGNNAAKDILRDKGFSGPITVLPQIGVDIDKLQKESHQDTPLRDIKKPIVGYIGRLVTEKGVDKLLQSFAGLPLDASLVYLGRGQLKDDLLEQAKKLKVTDRVHIFDTVPHTDVPAYLVKMDVLVLPSQPTATWHEQFGHVLIEAMGLGVPVIGSDSGAIPEVIGDSGLVFQHQSTKHLTNLLRSVLTDPSLKRKLSQSGLRRAQKYYSDDAIADSLSRIYQEILT